MAVPTTALVRCLLIVALLAGHGSVLTLVNSQEPAECGELCGGFVGITCVPMCECVYYEGGDYGRCLARGMNETDLPPQDE
ncbi:hypothetical protein HPB50_024048 [Hyalomma asiaticum]|uniref:Uncharacterized protein n=1 Tax=Hyalomma asiaticum TaxID=266040 RepID=A0ACB7SQH2_HYAAI|nr:hypothetical protein HPB50_024048 [Hyalomma asiaticum]